MSNVSSLFVHPFTLHYFVLLLPRHSPRTLTIFVVPRNEISSKIFRRADPAIRNFSNSIQWPKYTFLAQFILLSQIVAGPGQRVSSCDTTKVGVLGQVNKRGWMSTMNVGPLQETDRIRGRYRISWRVHRCPLARSRGKSTSWWESHYFPSNIKVGRPRAVRFRPFHYLLPPPPVPNPVGPRFFPLCDFLSICSQFIPGPRLSPAKATLKHPNLLL